LDEAISPALVDESCLTAGLVPRTGAGLLTGSTFADWSALDCLKTKSATIPTRASNSKTIAMTPAVKTGFDARTSLSDGRKLPAFGYEGMVGSAADLRVGPPRGMISVAGGGSIAWVVRKRRSVFETELQSVVFILAFAFWTTFHRSDPQISQITQRSP
jgi:hypothetical protein